MIQEQLRNLTHQMRLFGIHEAFERRAQEAVSAGMHPMEFLRLLLEDEILSRKDRVAQTFITRARFRSNADLEDWDVSFDRGVTKARFKELAGLHFFHNTENLLLFGKTGEGKSHLAVAVGRKACQENIRTLFMPVNFLFEEILAARSSGRYLNYVKRINKSKILILDDFGLRNYTHDEASVLLDILEDRYQKGAVIVTSQVNVPGWYKLFEDPVIAEAIVDRLKNPSQQVTLKGGTYREKLKQNTQEADKEKKAEKKSAS